MFRRYRFPLVVVFLLTALFVFAMVSSAAPAKVFEYKQAGQSNDIFVQDEILVKFKPDIKNEEIDKINRGLGIAAAHRTYSGVFRLKVPENKLEDMIGIFNRLPMVEYAEPNYIAYTFMTPNDSLYQYQWHMGNIQAVSAWDIQTGSPDVVVAVVDTGVAYENYGNFMQAPDLADTNFVPGYDFVNNDSHPNDDNSHGTHVAGTIAQSTNNGIGAAGIAFNASIMPVKVLGKKGSGTYTDIADGIKWAADHGAKVINMSLGGSVGSSTLETAVQYAYNKGVTIIAAAGNDGAGTVSYPAAYDDYVIAVGATRYDNTLSYYSNYGSSLDLVAPGGDVNVDQNGDGYGDGVLQNTFNPSTQNTKDFGYWFFQGTSMAAPHVSGVAALLIANNTSLSPDEVRNILQSTAADLGDEGRDDHYGYGLINAAAALGNSPPTPTNHPPVAADDSYAADEDTQLTVGAPGVLINDSDEDKDDSFTAVKVSSPSYGTLALNADGSFTYTPNNNYNGNDSFTYKAYDGMAYSTAATVTITVNAVNDAPVAVGESYSTNEGTTLTVGTPGVLKNDTDADGDALTAVLVNNPGHGSLTLNGNGSFNYTPTEGFTGDDSFSYKANDGSADSNIAEVTVTVDAVVEPPADAEAPTWPDGSAIRATNVTSSSLTLTWTAATDNVGVVTYKIYQKGSYIGEVDDFTLQYNVTGLSPNTMYLFGVEAYDAAGNYTYGPSVRVKTKK